MKNYKSQLSFLSVTVDLVAVFQTFPRHETGVISFKINEKRQIEMSDLA